MDYTLDDFKNHEKTKYIFPGYEDLLKKEEEANSLLQDPEMKEIAEEELKEVTEQKEKLWKEMNEILEKDKIEEEKPKAMILEIAAGAGGDESSLFAAELANMYQNYALKNRCSFEKLDYSESDVGGYKDVSFEIKGATAWDSFKFEMGVHRVQRVPDTEKNGRVHTSTVTVSVMPIRKIKKTTINPADIEMETYRIVTFLRWLVGSTGPGHVFGICENVENEAIKAKKPFEIFKKLVSILALKTA